MARRWSAMLAMAGLLAMVVPIALARVADAQPPVPPIVYDRPGITAFTGELFLTNPDGSGAPQAVPLNQLVDTELPVWSRDGRLLSAAAAKSGGGPQKDLYVFDPSGGGVRNITHLTTPGIPCGLGTQPPIPEAQAFSRDSGRLVYTLYEICTDPITLIQHKDFVIFSTRLSDGQTVNLGGSTITGFDGIGIDWSPTQDVIVTPLSTFDASFNPVTALFVGPPNTGALPSFSRITSPPGIFGGTVYDLYPTYSPAGDRIAFVRLSIDSLNRETATLRIVDGTGDHPVGPQLSNELITHIGWSQDGSTLVFDRGAYSPFNQGSLGLWTIGVDGTGLRNIVLTQAWAPSWAPTAPFAPASLLPALSNGAYGGFVTTEYIENVGNAPAAVNVIYFDTSGNAVGTGDTIASLPPNATWTVHQDNGNSFPHGAAGSAIVVSNQPIAAFVNEFAPVPTADGSSYAGNVLPGGAGTTLFAPAIANGAYGGYTTGIGLINRSDLPTNVTIVYRDTAGSAVKTQTLVAVPPHSYQPIFSGDPAVGLPAGFAGTATFTSSAGDIGAVVNETGPGGQFSSYDAVTFGSTVLYAPVALRDAYGGYNTGMAIQNTTGTAGTVTINYYDGSGAATTKSYPIAANGYLGVYQGIDIPVAGANTAKLTSTVPIASIVNEVAPSTTSAKQSTAYNTFASGAASAHLPLVESAGSDGWSTGEGIMNTGTAATTVTVTYYDTATGAQIGTPQSLSLQPNAFWDLYQPVGGLPNGMRASAIVTTAVGGQVAVICNESNATTFMSYNGG